MKNYLTRAKEIEQEIIEGRRHIHQNPELGLEMKKTSEYIKKRLEDMGYKPEYLGGYGLVATVGKPGKTILLRADMDALPIQEESGLDFASVNDGIAHCCGHDIHSGMLLGAAKLLKENEAELEGTVKLMFQPGEEVLIGARKMVEAGVLKNPDVDAAFAIHINALLESCNMLAFQGPLGASCDNFTIKVKGYGSHGARANESIDPINAACHIHLSLQEIIAREIPFEDRAMLTIGAFNAGETYNVIPEFVEMKGSLRTHNIELQKTIRKRLVEISEKTAEAFRATAEVVFEEGYTAPLVLDFDMSAKVKEYINEMTGTEKAVNVTMPSGPSEDFAFIANEVPSSFVIIGAKNGKDAKYGQHHAKVIYDEECLHLGSATYAQVATQWLKENKGE